MAQDAALNEKASPIIKRRGLTRTQHRMVAFYLFISPWILGFVLLGVIPLVF
jgi:hypothetical protein